VPWQRTLREQRLLSNDKIVVEADLTSLSDSTGGTTCSLICLNSRPCAKRQLRASRQEQMQSDRRLQASVVVKARVVCSPSWAANAGFPGFDFVSKLPNRPSQNANQKSLGLRPLSVLERLSAENDLDHDCSLASQAAVPVRMKIICRTILPSNYPPPLSRSAFILRSPSLRKAGISQ
jgi:hypothetical protein